MATNTQDNRLDIIFRKSGIYAFLHIIILLTRMQQSESLHMVCCRFCHFSLYSTRMEWSWRRYCKWSLRILRSLDRYSPRINILQRLMEKRNMGNNRHRHHRLCAGSHERLLRTYGTPNTHGSFLRGNLDIPLPCLQVLRPHPSSSVENNSIQ